jgi:hypothetical protein
LLSQPADHAPFSAICAHGLPRSRDSPLSSILSKCEVERQSDLIRLNLEHPNRPCWLTKLEAA